jgi:hypothetical protein
MRYGTVKVIGQWREAVGEIDVLGQGMTNTFSGGPPG